MKRRVGSRSPIECRPRTNVPFRRDALERGAAHARHDRHVEHDVGAVGDLDAAARVGRVDAAPCSTGTTYSVRPRMQPRNSSRILACASRGSIQLLLGPASSLRAACRCRSGARRARRRSDRSDTGGSPESCSGSVRAARPRASSSARRRCDSCVRAVAPVDPVRLRQLAHARDPFGDACWKLPQGRQRCRERSP